MEKRKKVLIQGFRGSYHEIAARKFFGKETEVIPTLTFDEVFRLLAADSQLFGVVAIENTLSGSILPNYHLLYESGIRVSGEVKLRVSLNLLALPGQDLADIEEVRSQALALMQCREFFSSYPGMRLIESADTALSAKEISECGLKGAGVVASTLAAELYGLAILAPNIESNSKNFTRFLILNPGAGQIDLSMPPVSGVNKASLVFRLPHRKGSLVEVLSVFSKGECNLTSVQSSPLIGSEWEYIFYVDMTFSDQKLYRESVREASSLCSELSVSGEYTEGEVFESR